MRQELQPLSMTRAVIVGPNVGLSPAQSLASGMTLHALATNLAKYGALSLSTGKVIVKWSQSDTMLNLSWIE